jgi:hypothetical protein
VKQGAQAQGMLAAAVRALPISAPVERERRVRPAAAVRADEPIGPARAQQGSLAPGLGTVLLRELRQRHTLLELDRILGHRG